MVGTDYLCGPPWEALDVCKYYVTFLPLLNFFITHTPCWDSGRSAELVPSDLTGSLSWAPCLSTPNPGCCTTACHPTVVFDEDVVSIGTLHVCLVSKSVEHGQETAFLVLTEAKSGNPSQPSAACIASGTRNGSSYSH